MPKLPLPKLPKLPTPKLPPGMPGKIGRKLARHPIAVISVATIGVRLGRDAYRLKKGEIDGPEWRARAGEHVGGVSGGIAGAMAGAVAFSIVPGVGPLIGGFAGGLIGELGGSRVGRGAIEAIE